MRPMLVLLSAAAIAACGPRAVPEPAEPVPAPPPRVARTSPPPPAEVCRCITICFVQNGGLREVSAIYITASRDTLTRDSLPISQVVPLTGEYASVAGWYLSGEAIRFRGVRYVKYGLPRVLWIREVEPAGEYDGVPVFVEAGRRDSVADYLYLPTRPGCEFQPYTVSARM